MSWPYNLTACIRVSNSFSFFSEQFDVVHLHLVVDLFLYVLFIGAFPDDMTEWYHRYYK